MLTSRCLDFQALWLSGHCGIFFLLLLNRRLYSDRLVNLQFGLVTFGLTGFFLVLTIAGLIQGSAWYNAEMVYRVLPELPVYMGLRAAFGVFIISAHLWAYII